MPSNLFDLFDEKSKTLHDSVATDPLSLDDISDKEEEQVLFIEKVKSFEQVRPKADYSDFANFVFFNSAYDYFNITGEKILNEYPYDGDVGQIEQFTNALDDYQRYVLSVWPRSAGHLRFNPANGFQYIMVDDVGTEEGVSRSSLLSLGTSSLTVELWSVPPPSLTGSNDVMVLLQKASASSDGYSAFFSGSRLHFRVTSGSTTDEVSVVSNPGQNTYFSFVYDRNGSTSILTAYTGSQTNFPVLVASTTGAIVGSVVAGSSRFYMGSGSLSSKRTRPLTGSLDNVRVWSYPLPLSEMSSTFNAKINSQKQLVALWRFNETGSIPNSTAQNSIVIDSSGHKLNGRIQNYSSAIRSSGSLVSFESPDLILNINTPEVQAYVAEQQASGSAHDRNSDNIITRLIPQMFFQMEQNEAQVLENFLYVLARQFDETKVKIDQFVKVLRADYTNFNQTPDALLADVGKFFGWEFTGNFLSSDVSQYILGRNVLKNVESNKELDKKLFEIKNEFWRRVLINLMHLYKTKGTRESVESLMRVYGVGKNFMKLKEYGYLPAAGIETNRISSEKTTFGLTFGSASFSASNYVRSDHFYTNAHSMEIRVRFPTTTTADVQPTTYTGWIFNERSGSSALDQLYYVKSANDSFTGSIFFQDRTGATVSLTGAIIFDGEWYNISVVKNKPSGTITLRAVGYEEGERTKEYSSYTSASISTSSVPTVLWVGASGAVASEMWANEVRLWDKPLTERELDDHIVNFQSYGVDDVRNIESLKLHWRLRENLTASAGGTIEAPIHDYSANRNFGFATGFKPSTNPYKKFLQEYSFIASPDFGWNEDKIRIVDSTKIDPNDSWQDNRVLALEANMVDALNEDISQMLSSMEGLNNSLGLPVNRYRSEYADLNRYRRKYFDKLQGELNFRVFADMLEFFDRSFIDMVKKMLPHRAKFLGDEFVVESHMLERPKMQWNYRRREQELVIEGSIKVYQRT